MKLYTKTGDDGSTGLVGGSRVQKDDRRIMAIGEIDEINAAIGVAVATCDHQETADRLLWIQSDLFSIGADLATPSEKEAGCAVDKSCIARLEKWIDESSSRTKPLSAFVLPGGTELAARLHLARTVCRRGERATVGLARSHAVNSQVTTYLNRLSDLLFALAREANLRGKVDDIPWVSRKP